MHILPRPRKCAIFAVLAATTACSLDKSYLGSLSEGTATSTGTATDAGMTAEPTTTAAPDSLLDYMPCTPADLDICPVGQMCCSDDPATLGGRRPNYYMDGRDDAVYGPPLFSDERRIFSHTGYCIDVGEFNSPLAQGCAVPCDPTWDQSTIAEICLGASCCPFTAVDPDKDCVLDEVTQRWRTVRGTDILSGLTAWGDAHATPQDTTLSSCESIAGGDQALLADCIAQLGVADRRGFCYTLDCPCIEDVCAMKNPDYTSRCP